MNDGLWVDGGTTFYVSLKVSASAGALDSRHVEVQGHHLDTPLFSAKPQGSLKGAERRHAVACGTQHLSDPGLR